MPYAYVSKERESIDGIHTTNKSQAKGKEKSKQPPHFFTWTTEFQNRSNGTLRAWSTIHELPVQFESYKHTGWFNKKHLKTSDHNKNMEGLIFPSWIGFVLSARSETTSTAGIEPGLLEEITITVSGRGSLLYETLIESRE